jgi:hypothetical protein
MDSLWETRSPLGRPRAARTGEDVDVLVAEAGGEEPARATRAPRDVIRAQEIVSINMDLQYRGS